MKTISRKTLSFFLSATLLMQLFILPVFAQSIEDIIQQTEQTEESIPEPDIVPEPSESVSTIPPQEPSEQVSEPTPPETEPSLETEPASEPASETEPSSAEPDMPLEQPAASPISIAEAIAESSNGLPMLIQGTVIFSADTYMVVEDDTGGMVISFENAKSLTPGNYIQVLVQFNGTFTALSCESIGTAPLPSTEVSLSDVPENRHVSVTQATIGDGVLTQDSASVPLATPVPQDIFPEDTVNASGVVIKGQFYADEITKVSFEPEPDDIWTAWYPVDYSQIHSGDTVIITVTSGNEIRALDVEEETLTATSVHSSSDTIECPETVDAFTIAMTGDTMAFQCASGWLSCDDIRHGLSITNDSECQWKVEENYLLHTISNRYLIISQDGTWEMLLDHQSEASDQILHFWRATPDSDQNDELLEGEVQPYFGLLHAHSTISDGTSSVKDMFEAASQVEGLDFYAVTDHSNSLDQANSGAIDANGSEISFEWKSGKDAAAAVSNDTFLGLYGYEISWGNDRLLGHISTLGTPGWTTSEQAVTLEDYFSALSSVPGAISQFNHPGSSFGNFGNFGNYQTQYDTVMQLIEVGDQVNFDGYEYYIKALDNGWHLAPSCNQNNHNASINVQNARTAVLCDQLTEDSLFQAIRNHQVYATQDPDLSITYRLNGSLMGSTIHEAGTLQAEIIVSDPTDSSIGLVEVISDGGAVVASQTVGTAKECISLQIPGGYHYYFLKITQPDQQLAVTAPVWVEDYSDIQIDSFLSDVEKPEQGQTVTLTLSLYNQEAFDFTIDTIRIYAEDSLIEEDSKPHRVEAAKKYTHDVPFTWKQEGIVHLRAVVTGNINGVPRTLEKALSLTFGPKAESVTYSPISEVRNGFIGDVYKVKGYITAGNANVNTTFADGMYLQDNSGGIAISGISKNGIQIGCPMEVVGVLRDSGNQLYLEVTDYMLPAEEFSRFVPRTLAAKLAMNYSVHGGELLQVEGTVVSVIKTSDGKGISRLTIKDMQGDQAVILIESNIKSGSTGRNELASEIKPGRTIRAMGICYLDDSGACVLRVRNCDEVTYIPPRADPTNPKTGDWLAFILSKIKQ